MGDVFCRKCGEPWDSFGITSCKGEGDMTVPEANMFLRGEGCPSCHWGKHCTNCHGTGKEKAESLACECRGSRYLIVRKLASGDGPWEYGYIPNVRAFPGEPKIVYQYPDGICKDGRFHEALVLWPYCSSSAEDCPTCHGTGELQPASDQAIEASLYSLVEETDQDVAELLEGGAG